MIRSMIARGVAAMALLSAAVSPLAAQTASFITVKDGAGTSQALGTGTAGGKLFYGFFGAAADGSVYQLASDSRLATLSNTVGAAGSPATSAQTVQPPATGFGVDTIVRSTPTNRSAVIGFSGTANAATSSSTSLTVNTTSNFTNQAGVLTGIPVPGQLVTGSGIPAGTYIAAGGVAQVSATQYTLTLTAAATVAANAAVTSGGPQQIMAANATRRGMSQQNQGTGDCFQNGVGSATTGPDSILIPSRTYNPSSDSHVGTGAVADICTTPATPLFAREW